VNARVQSALCLVVSQKLLDHLDVGWSIHPVGRTVDHHTRDPVPVLEQARRDGLAWDDAVVETFLKLLAEAPDTHVARRGGEAAAKAVSERAQRALRAGGVRSAAGRSAIDEMDRSLRDADPPSPEASARQAAARSRASSSIRSCVLFRMKPAGTRRIRCVASSAAPSSPFNCPSARRSPFAASSTSSR